VTAWRDRPRPRAKPIPVEVDKAAGDHGRYLHPELFGGEAITEIARARQHARRARQAGNR
jgi:hypothetical protein